MSFIDQAESGLSTAGAVAPLVPSSGNNLSSQPFFGYGGPVGGQSSQMGGFITNVGPSTSALSVSAGVVTDPIIALGPNAAKANNNTIPISAGQRMIVGEVIWVGNLSPDTRALNFTPLGSLPGSTLLSSIPASANKGDFAVGFGYSMVPADESNGPQILQLYAGGALIYDSANPAATLPGMTFTLHPGLPDAVPDPLIQAESQFVDGAGATGTLFAATNFANGNTVTIGPKTYTFQTTLTNVDGNVKISATSLKDSLTNLVAAINLSGGSGYAAAMTADIGISAKLKSDFTMIATAFPQGPQGDSITVSATGGATWGAPTLQGGVAPINGAPLAYRNMIYVVFSAFPLWLVTSDSTIPTISAVLTDSVALTAAGSLFVSPTSPESNANGSIVDWSRGLLYTFSNIVSFPSTTMHVFDTTTNTQIRTVNLSNPNGYPGTFTGIGDTIAYDPVNGLAFTWLGGSISNIEPIVSINLATGALVGSFGTESDGLFVGPDQGLAIGGEFVTIQWKAQGELFYGLGTMSTLNQFGVLGYSPDGTQFFYDNDLTNATSGVITAPTGESGISGLNDRAIINWPIIGRSDLESEYPGSSSAVTQKAFCFCGCSNQVFLMRVGYNITTKAPTIEAFDSIFTVDPTLLIAALLFDSSDGNLVVFTNPRAPDTPFGMIKFKISIEQDPETLSLTPVLGPLIYSVALPTDGFFPQRLQASLSQSRLAGDVLAVSAGSEVVWLDLSSGAVLQTLATSAQLAPENTDWIYDGPNNRAIVVTGVVASTEGVVNVQFENGGTDSILLSDAIRWMLIQGNYTEDEWLIDTAITDTIIGMIFTGQTDLWQQMADIGAAYNFVFFESDGVIKFVRNQEGDTATIVLNVTEDDLASADSTSNTAFESTITTMPAPQEIPDEVDLNYFDFDLGFTSATQPYHRSNFPPRPGAAQTSIAQSYNLPFIITGADAQARAASLAFSLPAGSISTSFRLPSRFLQFEPGDVGILTTAEGTQQVILQELVYNADWSISASAGNNDFSSSGTGTITVDPPLGLVPQITASDSQALMLDIPLLKTTQEMTTPVLNIGVVALSNPWTGASYLLEEDALAFNTIARLTSPNLSGTCSQLPDEPQPFQTHTDYTLTVTIKGADLESTDTTLDFLAGANAAIVGAPGRWEVIFYQNVQPINPTQYILSGITRGRRGTDVNVGTHQIGDQFIPITLAGANPIAPISIDPSELGHLLTAKAVGDAITVPAPTVSAVFVGNSKMPFAVTRLGAVLGSDMNEFGTPNYGNFLGGGTVSGAGPDRPDRRPFINVTCNFLNPALDGNSIDHLVDGKFNPGNPDYAEIATGLSDAIIVFDFTPFGVAQLITEYKWYQFTAANITMAFEGSPDGVTWTTLDAGTTFDAGDPDTVSFTNTTAYMFYRLRQSTGTTSTPIRVDEITFKTLSVTANPDDVVISWTRRDRLGQQFVTIDQPMSEATESYDLLIEDGSGNAVRALSGLAHPSYIYTDADQITDGFTPPLARLQLKVYQNSAIVGRGFPREVIANVG